MYHPPYVVLDCEGDPSIVMFQDGAWNRTLSNLKVFDDVFVDENVHSGLDVDATHRQHLHELILGERRCGPQPSPRKARIPHWPT